MKIRKSQDFPPIFFDYTSILFLRFSMLSSISTDVGGVLKFVFLVDDSKNYTFEQLKNKRFGYYMNTRNYSIFTIKTNYNGIRREENYCSVLVVDWRGKNRIRAVFVWLSIFMEQLCKLIVPPKCYQTATIVFENKKKPMQLAQTNWLEAARKIRFVCVQVSGWVGASVHLHCDCDTIDNDDSDCM